MREIVCEVLRESIVDGRLPQGSRLIEDRLADSLGVSRNPVREGLRVLESEGYVVMSRRRGACVATLSDDDVLRTFEVRGALEQLAWRLAARKASPTDLARLEQMLGEMRVALAEGDDERWTNLHAQFHALVLEMGDNDMLKRIMESFNLRMRWITHGVVWDRARALADHVQLLTTLASRDEQAAARLSEEHIRGFQEQYWKQRMVDDVEVVTGS